MFAIQSKAYHVFRCRGMAVMISPASFLKDSRILHRNLLSTSAAGRPRRQASTRRHPLPSKSAEQNAKIHREMYQKCLYIKSVLPQGQMDAESFQFSLNAIEAYTKQEEVDRQYLEVAEGLLNRIAQELHSDQSDSRKFSLSATPYIQIMRGWARTRSEESLDRCQALFQSMETWHQELPFRQPSPHQKHVYSAMMYACGLTAHPDARETADTWMKMFEKRAEMTQQKLPLELYNQIILVHAQRAAEEYGAAAAAEDWLIHVSQMYTQGGPSPTTDSFNRVIRAWSLSPETSAVQRAQTILNLMLKLQEDHDHVQPDADTFGTVLMACARHGQPHEADQLWRETLDYFIRRNKRIDLSRCLNAATLAWSKSNLPEAAARIEALLHEGLLQQAPSSSIKLDSVGESLTNLLVAYVKQGDVVTADNRLRKFWEMHVNFGGPAPLHGALHYLVEAYHRSPLPDKAKRASDLVLHSLNGSQTFRSVSIPDTATFNLCIEMCTKDNQGKDCALKLLEAAESSQRASVYTYSLLINALCRENRHESCFAALHVLKKLAQADADPRNQLQLRSNDLGLYTAVLSVVSKLKAPDAADACLDLLESVKSSHRWHPSLRMYSSVIFSMRLRGKEGRRKAFELFKEMLEMEKDPKAQITADAFVFETVLRVLLSADDREAAGMSCEVLSTMIRLYDSGRRALEPNRMCFDACLRTLLGSGDKDMIRQAKTLAQSIQKRHSVGHFSALPSDDVLQLVGLPNE